MADIDRWLREADPILDEFRALGLLRTLGLFAVAALVLVALGAFWWLAAAVLV